MALLLVIFTVFVRLSLDWIEILDQRKELRRQEERREKLNIERHVETVETRVEEFEMYVYEYGV